MTKGQKVIRRLAIGTTQTRVKLRQENQLAHAKKESTFVEAKTIISVTTRLHRSRIRIIILRMPIRAREINRLIERKKETEVTFEAEAVKEETEAMVETVIAKEKRDVVMTGLVAIHAAE